MYPHTQYLIYIVSLPWLLYVAFISPNILYIPSLYFSRKAAAVAAALEEAGVKYERAITEERAIAQRGEEDKRGKQNYGKVHEYAF
jgi:hypothetical protein